MNLVSNATEAMETTGGGVLSIEASHVLSEDSLQINLKDTGPGIPQENIPKLFEPFFTTKKKGKGVGLGLSVAIPLLFLHSLIASRSRVLIQILDQQSAALVVGRNGAG